MPGVVVMREIEMEMVAVILHARAEDGLELRAGGGERLAQEAARIGIGTVPIGLDRDHAPVGQLEAGDIERVAEGMLGQRYCRARN